MRAVDHSLLTGGGADGILNSACYSSRGNLQDFRQKKITAHGTDGYF